MKNFFHTCFGNGITHLCETQNTTGLVRQCNKDINDFLLCEEHKETGTKYLVAIILCIFVSISFVCFCIGRASKGPLISFNNNSLYKDKVNIDRVGVDKIDKVNVDVDKTDAVNTNVDKVNVDIEL